MVFDTSSLTFVNPPHTVIYPSDQTHRGAVSILGCKTTLEQQKEKNLSTIFRASASPLPLSLPTLLYCICIA